MDWMCETEECLIDIKVYDNLIQSQTTLDWIPSNYSQFWGRTLQEGLNGKLGTESTLVNRIFFLKKACLELHSFCISKYVFIDVLYVSSIVSSKKIF